MKRSNLLGSFVRAGVETLKRFPAFALAAIAASGFAACSDSRPNAPDTVATTQEALSGSPDPVVRYWFNETSGALANDSSGNGHSATLQNGATFVAGARGNAVRIAGGTQRVELPQGVVQACEDLTIAARVNLSASPASWARIFDFGSGATANMFLTPRAGGNVLRFAITNGGTAAEQQISYSYTFPQNTWKHVAVVLNGNTGTMYLDGVQVAQAPITLNPSILGLTTNNSLGDSQYPADPTLNGSVDDVLVSCRAYSAAEVAWLAAGTDPLAAYSFNETSGTTAADSSGNARHATLVNGASFVSGLHGNAVQIAGGSQRVNLPTGVVQSCTDLTIAGHIRLASNTTNWARIFDFGASTTSYMFLTPRAGASNVLRFAITTGGGAAEQRLSYTYNFPTSVWKHVAVVLSGNTGTMYLDGAQVAQNTALTLNPSVLGATANNWLGDSQFTADPTLNGTIDNLLVTCRAYSPAEIGTLAGACTTAAQCNDGNACTTDTCNAGFCSRSSVANGISCVDANVCNGAESCQSGWCSAGTPLPVDDGNACTADACDPVQGVTHTPITGGACGGGGAGAGGSGGTSGAGGSGGSSGSSGSGGSAGATCPTGTTAVEMFTELPRNTPRASIALGSYGTPLDIHDRVRVLAPGGGFASVSSLTTIPTNPTRLGVESHVHHFFAEPRLELRDRARVHGNAVSPGQVTLFPVAAVDGQIIQQALTPHRREAWLVCHPNTHQGNIDVQPGQVFPANGTRLATGAWGTLAVKTGARIRLRGASTYFFESIAIEPGAIVDLDTAAGGIQLYFRNGGFFRGVQERTNTTSANVLFGAENGNFTINGSFRGTVVAPRGVVDLPTAATGHRGSFFGALVVAHQSTDITHETLDTTGMCAPGVCNGLCSCGSGQTGCDQDSDCAEGLACLEGFGPRFGKPRGTNVCAEPGCRTHFVELGCGFEGATCGVNCENGIICEDDADCPSPEICGFGKGPAYGLPFENVCVPPVCVTDPVAGGCSIQGALCGECPCTTTCETKTCGQDPADGCGGRCREFCDNREPGCTADADCSVGSACIIGAGPRIGLAEGVNVCLPVGCLDPNPARSQCGSISSACGTCPPAPIDACDGRDCGFDPTGQVRCGNDCEAGFTCTAGQCVEEYSIRSTDLPTISPATRETLTIPVSETAVLYETSVPGALAGSFGVNSQGRPTYSVPIVVPPGRLGLEPSVSLSYVGGGSNGLMGTGWSVGGLSSISRCPRIAALRPFPGVENGWALPVEYTNQDQLCLDGNPLIRVRGRNLTPGAEYRTEIETFTKVTAISENGLLAFEVRKRDGRIFTYGGSLKTELHRVRDSGVVRAWALARIEDRTGNCIGFDYGKFVADGRIPEEAGEDQTVEFWPSEIAYGGKKTTRPVGGVSRLGCFDGSRSVKFTYSSDRKDYMEGYTRGGGRIVRTKLLEQVDAKVGSQVIRSYELDYEAAPSGLQAIDGITRLSEVRECSNKFVTRECKRPTTFTYTNAQGLHVASDGSSARKQVSDLGLSQQTRLIVLDWNGDGFDDILATNQLLVARPDGSGMYDRVPTSFTSGCFGQNSVFDFNQDGKDDLLETCDGQIFLGTGDPGASFETAESIREKADIGSRPYLVDLNGDGIKDLFNCDESAAGAQYHGDVWHRLGRVGGGFEDTKRGNMQAWASCGGFTAVDHQPAPILVSDIDGDGIEDVLMGGSGEGVDGWARYVPHPDGSASWVRFVGLPDSLVTPARYNMLRFIDVNGDGLKDIYALLPVVVGQQATRYVPTIFTNFGGRFDEGHYAYHVAASLADPFATIPSINSSLAIDYNGDGREDLIRLFAPRGLTSLWQFDPSVATLLDSGATPASPVLGPDPAGAGDGSTSYFFPQPGIAPAAGRPCSGAQCLPSSEPSSTLADADGDGSVDLIMVAADRSLVVMPGHFGREHLLARVVDGMGKRIDVGYGSRQNFTDGPFRTHEPATDCVRSNHELGFSLCARHVGPLVSNYVVGIDQGAAGSQADRSYRLRYRGGREGLLGRGWLGYDQRVIEERAPDDRLITRTEVLEDNRTFNQGYRFYPFAGLESFRSVITGLASSALATEATRQRSNRTNRWILKFSLANEEELAFPFLEESRVVVDEVEASGTSHRISQTTSFFTGDDRFGNVTHAATTLQGPQNIIESVTVADSSFHNREDLWLLGLPDEVAITDQRGLEAVTRTAHYDYDFDAGLNPNPLGEERGLLMRVTREPNAGGSSASPLSLRQVTEYERDPAALFQVTSVTTTGSWTDSEGEVVSGSRKTSVEYGPGAFFPRHVHGHRSASDDCSQAAGNAHTEACLTTDVSYDSRDGTLAIRVDPTGIGERFTYDGFGRIVARESASDTVTTTYRDAGPDPGAIIAVSPKMVVLTTSQNTGATTSQFFDSLGRVVQTASAGIGGEQVLQEYEYFFGNLVSRATRPHAAEDPSQGIIQNLYDSRFRLTEQVLPDDAPGRVRRVRYEYAPAALLAGVEAENFEAFVTAVVDPKAVADSSGRRTMSFSDARGLSVRASDAKGKSTRYSYGPFGVLQTIVETIDDDDDHVTTIQSDALGRTISHRDDDSGLTKYSHTAFDEVVAQIDNANRTTGFRYDNLGRLLRTESDASDGDIDFAYDGDPADNALGRLVEARTATSQGDLTVEQYAYEPRPASDDPLKTRGFLDHTTRTIGSEEFTTSLHYNEKSQLDRVTYPATPEPGAPNDERPFNVHYGYDAFGNMTCASSETVASPVANPADCGTGRFWRLDEAFQGYRIKKESAGNGVTSTYSYEPLTGRLSAMTTVHEGVAHQSITYPTYDANGNLTERRQAFRNPSGDPTSVIETFGYDELNRLERVTPQGSPAQTFEYTGEGNIRKKHDVGTYSYTSPNPGELRGPHAVRRITRNDGVVINNFGYDNVGNLRTRSGEGVEGGTQTYTYTSFNLPQTVTVGDGGTGTKNLRYEYDAAHRRVLLSIDVNGNAADLTPGEEKRLYVGSGYEKVTTNDTSAGLSTRHLYKVFAAGRQVAQVERLEQSGIVLDDERRYIHGDHLGSSQLITKEDGALVHVQRFDPFGAPIDPAAGSGDAVTENIRAGFTGHETDVETGLVNMGGRIYDPRLGRFMQADPILQPGWSQTLNRYSYVANNPLNATDPSGFCEDCDDEPEDNPNLVAAYDPAEGFVYGAASPGATPGIPPAPEAKPSYWAGALAMVTMTTDGEGPPQAPQPKEPKPQSDAPPSPKIPASPNPAVTPPPPPPPAAPPPPPQVGPGTHSDAAKTQPSAHPEPRGSEVSDDEGAHASGTSPPAFLTWDPSIVPATGPAAAAPYQPPFTPGWSPLTLGHAFNLLSNDQPQGPASTSSPTPPPPPVAIIGGEVSASLIPGIPVGPAAGFSAGVVVDPVTGEVSVFITALHGISTTNMGAGGFIGGFNSVDDFKAAGSLQGGAGLRTGSVGINDGQIVGSTTGLGASAVPAGIGYFNTNTEVIPLFKY